MNERIHVKIRAKSLRIEVSTTVEGAEDLILAHDAAYSAVAKARIAATAGKGLEELVKQALPTVQPSTSGHAKPRAKAAAGK